MWSLICVSVVLRSVRVFDRNGSYQKRKAIRE